MSTTIFGYLKKHNVPALLLMLVLSISYLAFYNYDEQKDLLLTQMKSDTEHVGSSISSAMQRFHDIKSTMNLQKLVNDVSFGLEIFEFRYLEPNGIIRNSMFNEEIGKLHSAESFKEILQRKRKLKTFFFEVRDYVKVMAIYYPIYRNKRLIGIIDLAVDVSEYAVITGPDTDFALTRRKVDILNLLKSIEGSIENSLAVFEETDMHNFLRAYVQSAANILEVSQIDADKKILMSSNKKLIGKTLKVDKLLPLELIDHAGRQVYRTVTDIGQLNGNANSKLIILIDAAPYEANRRQLLETALITSVIALIIALFIARSIYYFALERSRSEKERLERLVKERTHEIELLSKTDALTGLWNRGYLEEMLEMEYKRARRYMHDISIMLIDLDHFKRINDTYGHMAGDEVLRQISQRIRSCVRETDFVGRYGGEELVIILPETTLRSAQTIADNILKLIAAEPVVFESHTIDVTTSIGLNNLRLTHTNYQAVFAETDEALYRAKEEGRNRVVVFKAD